MCIRDSLRRGLAGRRSGDLLPVEPLPGHLGFHPLRRPAHSLPAHAHRPDPRPDLQDPALCVVTVIVLVFTSMRNNRDKQPPASLGLAYFREER